MAPTEFEISPTVVFGKSKKQRHGPGLYFAEVLGLIELVINRAFGQRNAKVKMSRGRGLRMNGDGGFGLGITSSERPVPTGDLALLGRPSGRPFSPNPNDPDHRNALLGRVV